MKRFAILTLAAALVLVAAARPALAGTAARHRAEGAMLALGTLGFLAILSEVAEPAVTPLAVETGCRPYRTCPPEWPGRYGRTWVPGSWVEIRVWIPGRIESVWEPDRWDRRGRFRPGRWVRRQGPDRYETRRVWRDGHFR